MCFHSTIFIIENDAAVRDAFNISLTTAGFKTENHVSGQSFLEAYSIDRPGCLLMDLSVPEMKALALQKELIRRHISIPIIFLTDILTQRDALLAIESGVFQLLEKPFRRSLLLKRVAEAISKDCCNRSMKHAADSKEINHSTQSNIVQYEYNFFTKLINLNV